MLTPDAGEYRALTTFFQKVCYRARLYDQLEKKLKEGAVRSARFQKNLKMLRELVEQERVTLTTFANYCTIAQREKHCYESVRELVPEEAYSPTERNLIKDSENSIHRLLRSVTVPVSKLEFGASSTSESLGEIEVTSLDRFTMGDLLTHYYSAFGIQRTRETDARTIGAFNHLLDAHELDIILFAIDCAAESAAPIASPFDLLDRNPVLERSYIQEAREEIKGRKARR